MSIKVLHLRKNCYTSPQQISGYAPGLQSTTRTTLSHGSLRAR